MDIHELREKKAKLIDQGHEVLNRADTENREMKAEENEQYERIWDEIKKIDGRIQREEQLREAERNLGDKEKPVKHEPENRDGKRVPTSETEEYRSAFQRFLRGGMNALNSKDRDVVDRAVAERRALQADSDEAGGYIILPQQFQREILKAVDNQVYIRQYANTQTLTNAESLGVPSLDNDPADPTWTSELQIGTEDSTMSFGKRELRPHPLAKFIKVSRKLLRASDMGVEALVRDRLAYKQSVTQENAYLNGSGAGQPLGIYTASNDGISTSRDVSTGNTSTSITFDGLKEAKYTLKTQYWARARWNFHRDAVKQIDKLKDGEGRYLIQPDVSQASAMRVLGFPVDMSEYAPNTFTTGKYVGALAVWQFYDIVDALTMEIQRLNELYAATNQVGFIIRSESDGMPVLEEAFVRVTLG